MHRHPDITDGKVRKLLQRILNSRSFAGVERLNRFLEFVVTETLEGRGDQLKEFAVGEYAFEKGPSFDPRNDPIVRVQARRLRARLDRYHLEEGADDEIRIDLPKGGYVPTFRLRDSDPPRRALTAVLLDQNSVIVEPFEPTGSDPDLPFVSRSLRQEIIQALTKLEGVNVLAFEADTRTLTPGSMTAHSGAATIVSGMIQQRGHIVRISWLLLDTSSGSFLVSGSTDSEVSKKSFAVQEQVAQDICRAFREGLAKVGSRRGSARTTKNVASHNLYLQGRHHLDQRTEEGLRLAVTMFERAIAEDSQFAKAHAGLADAYELLGHYGVLAPVEVWTKAPSSASLAVLLDDRCAEAHTALAHVRSTEGWDWAGSEQEFRRALELDPLNATAHHWYAMSCLSPMGRLDEALASIHLAKGLAPLSSIIARDVATVYYYRREYEAALESCDLAIELDPYFSQSYWTLGFIQEQRKDHAESVAAFTRALELGPQNPRNKASLGRALALNKKRKEALQILKDLMMLSETRYVSTFQIASIHFALNQNDEGFEWLKKAFQDRCFELMLLKVDPKFDFLRNHPQFIELAAQLRLP